MKGSRRAYSSVKQPQSTGILDTTPKDKDITNLQGAIKNARQILCESAFYTSLLVSLNQLTIPLSKVQRLVTYGLGSLARPGTLHIRYQAALMIQLAGMMPNLMSLPESYDPVYTTLDKSVLNLIGTRVLEIDQGGERVAEVPTFFYMPHCEIALTLALLACNLASGTLHNVLMLGNSLSQYTDRWSVTSGTQSWRSDPQTIHQKMETLLRSIKVQEVPCPEHGFPVTSAFNDMSLHTFSLFSETN